MKNRQPPAIGRQGKILSASGHGIHTHGLNRVAAGGFEDLNTLFETVIDVVYVGAIFVIIIIAFSCRDGRFRAHHGADGDAAVVLAARDGGEIAALAPVLPPQTAPGHRECGHHVVIPSQGTAPNQQRVAAGIEHLRQASRSHSGDISTLLRGGPEPDQI